MALGPRSYSRSILRGFVAELRHMGILEEVRARASPQLLPLLADPRRAPAWLPVAPLDEIVAAVVALRGRQAARDVGYHSMQAGGLATVLEPIIQLSLAMLGSNPAALFSRAQLMASVISRGIELTWLPAGPASGTMRIECGDPAPATAWLPWEGAFLYAFELAKCRGTVGEARPAADGRSAEIDVHWESR